MQARRGQHSGAQRFAQRLVLAVAGQAGTEDRKRALDAAPQVPEHACSEPLRLLRPLLQPAALGPVAVARHEARRVYHQPQQHEVGVDLADKHRLEIEVEERLPRQRLVVA